MVEAYLLAKKTVCEKYSKRHKYYPFFVTCLYALLCEYWDHADIVVQAFLECEFYLENNTISNILRKYKIDQIDIDHFHEEEDCISYGVSGPGYMLSCDDDGNMSFKKEAPFIACCVDPNELERVINTFCHEMSHLIKSRENACFMGEDDERIEFILRSGFSYSYYYYYPQKEELQSFQRFTILDEAINCIQTTEALSYIPSLSFVEDRRILKFISSLDFDVLREDCGYDMVVPIVRILWDDQDTREVIQNNIVEEGMMEFLTHVSSIVGSDHFSEFVNLLDSVYSSFEEENYDQLQEDLYEAKKIVLSFREQKKLIKEDS